ncbi:hypothetical protein B0I35DRAFT_363416 [Stachybotrys elegans]|uniref:Glucose-methanol-choline oxidoreductase N-terminal domain-containing protein n=1 Tax=Stachybotrys elegans TaxID=80388 RepID=A0A8K0SEJ0_9HYPO|nr:hypothetical protein B0I35DRAFT_363416 [Stachybotrys elegans]
MFDYIIVGGGLCGCVLASRLREYNRDAKILLIEAGQDTRSRKDVQEPQVLNLGGDLDWQYQTLPVPALSHRTITINSGKGLGGSSAINSGGWTRGAAIDFDEWATVVGDNRYSYEGQLPWLKKAERWFDTSNPDQHGQDGPIRIASAHSMNRQFPLGQHTVKAWEEMGVSALPDLDQNAGRNLGVASLCEARDDGKRQWSAYLYPLDGVEILLNTVVRKIILQSEGGALEATGVQLADNSILSARNVILSAGAIRSPQLLQLSGIGSSEDLKKLGINVKVDAPEVGKNLADHMLTFQHWRLRDPSAGYTLGSSNPLFLQPQYGKGNPVDYIVCTSVPNDGLAKEIAKDEGVSPDPAEHRLLTKPRTFLEHILIHAKLPFPGVPMDTEHVTTGLITLLPTSRGSVSLISSHVEDQPKIETGYLSTNVDRHVAREGLRQVARLMLGPTYGRFVAEESVPDALRPLGIEPLSPSDSDEMLDKRLAFTAGTSWHVTGTCSMGKVVDGDFKVKGVKGLRVVDASVVPISLSSHIQAALYGLAEQAADIIANRV